MEEVTIFIKRSETNIKLEKKPIPEGMKGVPAALVVAGILALAFMGFSGLV